MSDTLPYLAGIFDGEGSIGFFSAGRKKGSVFTLEVGMTDEIVITLLHEELGGWKWFKGTKDHRKEMWRWRVEGEAAWDAYYKLRPYLRVKRWLAEPHG
jgi:hypothetical protein